MNREERKKILCRQMELLAEKSECMVTVDGLCNLTNTMVNLNSAICTQENWDLHYVENPDEAKVTTDYSINKAAEADARTDEQHRNGAVSYQRQRKYDTVKVEDVDTSTEDHSYDAARYFLMEFPVPSKNPAPAKKIYTYNPLA